MFIYSVYDKKAMYHKSQFFERSDAEALRQFIRAANDSRTDICQFPADFDLYCLGEFDINNGVVSGFNPLKFIACAESLIKIDKSESN